MRIYQALLTFAIAAGVFTHYSAVVRLGLVSVISDPPHRPGPDRFAFDVETDGKKCEKCHHARIHPVGSHVAKLDSGRYQTNEGSFTVNPA